MAGFGKKVGSFGWFLVSSAGFWWFRLISGGFGSFHLLVCTLITTTIKSWTTYNEGIIIEIGLPTVSFSKHDYVIFHMPVIAVCVSVRSLL